MHKVLFRGGKFDGRSRNFGSLPAGLIEVPVGDDTVLQYLNTGQVDAGALIYELVGDAPGVDLQRKIAHASLPFVVHFIGGPYARKGRFFAADPAEVLVIPIENELGWFVRYKRAAEQLPGRPLLYDFVEKFEGER